MEIMKVKAYMLVRVGMGPMAVLSYTVIHENIINQMGHMEAIPNGSNQEKKRKAI
jgi:hypothetical protein